MINSGPWNWAFWRSDLCWECRKDVCIWPSDFLVKPFKHCLSWGHPLYTAFVFPFVFYSPIPEAKASLVVRTESVCSGLSVGCRWVCGEVCTCSLSPVQLLRPHGLQPSRLLCPWNFPGKNTGVVCHFLLQGIFLTQGSNLKSCISCIGRWILNQLRAPNYLKCIVLGNGNSWF